MSHNDITGDKIKSKDNSDDFRNGWDKINWDAAVEYQVGDKIMYKGVEMNIESSGFKTQSDLEKVREKNFERYDETYKKMTERNEKEATIDLTIPKDSEVSLEELMNPTIRVSIPERCAEMTKDDVNPDWKLGLCMFNFNELVDALVGICGEEPTEAYKVESELIGEELKRRFKK